MAIKEYIPSSDKKVHRTSIDFILRNCTKEVHIVQYDKTQPIVEVELFNNEKSYSLPENAIMNLRFSKPDRTFVYKPILGCNKDRNIVYFDIDQQMSFLYGKVNPILELILNDTIAGSSPIPIEIDRNPIQNGDFESSSEYPAIIDAANKALESASKSEEAANKALKLSEEIKEIYKSFNISALEETKEVYKEDKIVVMQSGETKSATFGTLTIDDIDLTNILSN